MSDGMYWGLVSGIIGLGVIYSYWKLKLQKKPSRKYEKKNDRKQKGLR